MNGVYYVNITIFDKNKNLLTSGKIRANLIALGRLMDNPPANSLQTHNSEDTA
jgi:hypothetical protein